MKKLLLSILLCSSLAPLFPQNRMTLDNAIKDFAAYVTSQLPTNNRNVAVVAFETDKRNLMAYVIDTTLEKIWEKGTDIRIFERQRLEPLQRELDFSMTGYVSDDTAQRIGQAIGVDTVIYGSMNTMGNMHRLTLRATDVETFQILVPKSYDLRADSRLRGLLETAAPEAGSEVYFWTVGASLGTSFAEPWIIGTVFGTIAPFRYSFLEIGFELGLVSGAPDVTNYYCVYPYAHYAYFMPFAKGGWYAGAGVGYMVGERSYQDQIDPIRIIAADIKTGLNIGNNIDVSYTLRTNFQSLNNKIAVGYTHRFNRE